MRPSASAFSWMRTASAPLGIGAPVKMRTQWPLATLPLKPWPAAEVPASFSVTGVAARSADITA